MRVLHLSWPWVIFESSSIVFAPFPRTRWLDRFVSHLGARETENRGKLEGSTRSRERYRKMCLVRSIESRKRAAKSRGLEVRRMFSPFTFHKSKRPSGNQSRLTEVSERVWTTGGRLPKFTCEETRAASRTANEREPGITDSSRMTTAIKARPWITHSRAFNTDRHARWTFRLLLAAGFF